MVISQPPGNNPSYYYRASPTLPQLLWMLPETPYVLYMQLQHQVNPRNKAYFYTNQIHGGIISRLFLFIFCRSMFALHLAVKILLQIFLYEDLSMVTLHTSVGCISLQNASRTALCYATNIIKWKIFLIFDINHQQNTRISDQIETIKTILQKLRALVSHGRFYQWLRLSFLKKYSIKCEKI